MVDTTCGSVLNVWKNVKRYAQDGFTSIIHGKVWHEETQATASQALAPSRRPLSRRPEPRGNERWCATTSGAAAIARRSWRDSATRCPRASIPTAILQHIGLANQTTMLMSESLEVQDLFRQAMPRPVRRGRHSRRDSARSTRFAAPRRTGRTRWSPCSGEADRPDGRHRRLQQQQHVQSGPHLRPDRCPPIILPTPTAWSRPTPSATGPRAAKSEVRATGWLPAGEIWPSG